MTYQTPQPNLLDPLKKIGIAMSKKSPNIRP